MSTLERYYELRMRQIEHEAHNLKSRLSELRPKLERQEAVYQRAERTFESIKTKLRETAVIHGRPEVAAYRAKVEGQKLIQTKKQMAAEKMNLEHLGKQRQELAGAVSHTKVRGDKIGELLNRMKRRRGARRAGAEQEWLVEVASGARIQHRSEKDARLQRGSAGVSGPREEPGGGQARDLNQEGPPPVHLTQAANTIGDCPRAEGQPKPAGQPPRALKDLAALQGWHALETRGLEVIYRTRQGWQMGVSVSADQQRFLTVRLLPMAHEERRRLKEERAAVIDALKQAGFKVRAVVVEDSL